MDRTQQLSSHTITGPVRVCQPEAALRRLTPDSPALDVMTDLARVPAATIDSHTQIGEAERTMRLRGVRMLLVTEQGLLAGVITATDLLGERPIRLAQERRIRHAELQVGDVMTPLSRLEALLLHEVEHARVSAVIANLREHNRQHAVVLDVDAQGHRRVRGIFSLSQIARQLGVTLELSHAATSFAEIEEALAH
jgi:CBS domain-containing protein